jgi:5-methyltetrahydropteroyltriglutamate--homocysteine methyltransferase
LRQVEDRLIGRSAMGGKSEHALNIRFCNGSGTVEFSPTAHRVGGRLQLDETIFAEDFGFLNSVAAAVPPHS